MELPPEIVDLAQSNQTMTAGVGVFLLSALKAGDKTISEAIAAARATAGALYEPAAVRRKLKVEREAERDSAIMRAQTELDISDLQSRARYRAEVLQITRQHNLERVIEEARLDAPPDTPAYAPADGWSLQFIEAAGGVDDDDLRALWSRILAGEVQRPGTYSLRTLQTLRLMSKRELEIFALFCRFVWDFNDGGYYVKTEATEQYLTSVELPWAAQSLLADLGLVRIAIDLGVVFPSHKGSGKYHGRQFVFIFPDVMPPPFTIPVVALTAIGNDLRQLTEDDPDQTYINVLAESLSQQRSIKLEAWD